MTGNMKSFDMNAPFKALMTPREIYRYVKWECMEGNFLLFTPSNNFHSFNDRVLILIIWNVQCIVSSNVCHC